MVQVIPFEELRSFLSEPASEMHGTDFSSIHFSMCFNFWKRSKNVFNLLKFCGRPYSSVSHSRQEAWCFNPHNRSISGDMSILLSWSVSHFSPIFSPKIEDRRVARDARSPLQYSYPWLPAIAGSSLHKKKFVFLIPEPFWEVMVV